MYTYRIMYEGKSDEVGILTVIHKRRVVQPERIGRSMFRLKNDRVGFDTTKEE